MNVTEHQRPGVYSVYDASSAVSGRRGGGAVGIVSACGRGTVGKVYLVNGREEAAALFGDGAGVVDLVDIALKNGASKVYVVPLAATSEMPMGFAAMETVEDVKVVMCDTTVPTALQAMRDSVVNASKNRRERIGVGSTTEGGTLSTGLSTAESLNCERIILMAGAGNQVVAALVGAIAGESDPAMPLGGMVLRGVENKSRVWTEAEIDTQILGGVTPVETRGGEVQVVRAVTTRTKTGSAADATWREATTIRIVDDVVPGLRDALRAKFSRAKNTEQGRGAIRSQVVVELENKKAQEIIDDYDNVTVSAVEGNPTVCLVEFSFSVAHGLNQIWLSAHITV